MKDSTAHNPKVTVQVTEELYVDHIPKTLMQYASPDDVSGKNKGTLSGHPQFTGNKKNNRIFSCECGF